MPQNTHGFSFDSFVYEGELGYDGLPIQEVVIQERARRGHANYKLGMDVQATIGDMTLRDTASLDFINVQENAQEGGLGAALMIEFITEAKEASLRYANALLANPLSVRLIDGALREGILTDRIYYISGQSGWDLPSEEAIHRLTAINPEEAATAITAALDEEGEAVRCLMAL
jgi:hypothetical protein